MKDIILKRNELCKKSIKLRCAKFQADIPREKVTKLIEEQDKIYKKYKFYDNFIKIGGKIKWD